MKKLKTYKLILQDRDTNQIITFDEVYLTYDNYINAEKRGDWLGLKIIEIKRTIIL